MSGFLYQLSSLYIFFVQFSKVRYGEKLVGFSSGCPFKLILFSVDFKSEKFLSPEFKIQLD
jgi:hypothetical protein